MGEIQTIANMLTMYRQDNGEYINGRNTNNSEYISPSLKSVPPPLPWDHNICSVSVWFTVSKMTAQSKHKMPKLKVY